MESQGELQKEVQERLKKERETFRRQMGLIEPRISPEYLIESASFLQPIHYQDIASERSIALLCGYPLCNSKLDKKSVNNLQKYSISLSRKRVYEVSELKCYCSEKCLIASRMYLSQLDETPVYMRTSPTRIIIDQQEIDSWRAKNIVEHPNPSPSFEFPSPSTSNLVDGMEVDANSKPTVRPQKRPVKRLAKPKENAGIQQDIRKAEESLSQLTIDEEKQPTKKVHFDEPSLPHADIQAEPDILVEAPPPIPALSPFGLMFVTLEHWCTRQTKYFLNGMEDSAESTQLTEDSNSSLFLETPSASGLRKKTMCSIIGTHFPILCQNLRLKDGSGLEKELWRCIDTFSFQYPLESFTPQQWGTFLLVFLEVLSRRNRNLDDCLHANDSEMLKNAMKLVGVSPESFKIFVEVFS